MPDLNNPKWMMSGKGRFDENTVSKVMEVLDLLSGHLNLSVPKVHQLEGLPVIIVEADKWFIRSSVTNHMLLTFIRGSMSAEQIAARNIFEWVNKMFIDQNRRHNNGYETSSDHRHLSQSQNLGRILTKEAECVNRYEDTDWFVRRRAADTPELITWRGVYSWSPSQDSNDLIDPEVPISRLGMTDIMLMRDAFKDKSNKVWQRDIGGW
jgi:hypothetical protein